MPMLKVIYFYFVFINLAISIEHLANKTWAII